MPGVFKEQDFNTEGKANDLAYFLITQNSKQTIIKRADMIKYILKDMSRNFDSVFKEAVNKLNKVFGYDVLYIESKKGYLMVNKLESQESMLCLPKEKKQKLGLIFLILSHIHNSGGVVTEENLWTFLNLFGIKPDSMHNVFGDVHKLIHKTLTQECYLEITTVTLKDLPCMEIRMGPRATHELIYSNFARFNHDLIQM